jgi:predicted phage terminase large subunit-like protein
MTSRFNPNREAQLEEARQSPENTAPLEPLSVKRLKLEQELASRVLARRRLLPFVQRMNDRYLAGWVHEDICRRLEKFSDDVAAGKSPRLMLLMPPRHGKSELASKNFPAWHLGRFPDHEFIACSYNLSLAMGFSRKVKQLIDDASYQSVFETRLDPNNSSTEEWGIKEHRGGYVAAGIGGPITGKGAHVLVIDDPVKNAEEADSGDTREKIWEWYLSTAYTRLAPGGGVLIIQTWWHDDDLAGRIQALMAQALTSGDEDVDQFEVIKYPALAEKDEYLDPVTDKIVALPEGEAPAPDSGLVLLRSKGQALHPDRYNEKALGRIRALNRKSDGSDGRWWSALYQQNPVPDDGSYFTKDQFRRGQPPVIGNCRVYIAWDFAISEKQQNDWTVGSVALQDEHDVLHIAEVVRFKSGDAFFIVESILNLTSKWYSPSLILGFEDGQIYKALASLLKKRMRERKIYPAIEVLKPITDKMARARALQGRMQQGMVSFSDNADWYDTVRAEMLRFPAGIHDDCVDSLAWVAQLAMNREPPRAKDIQPKMKSWKDKLGTLGLGEVTHMAA